MKILITTGSWNASLVVMKSLARRGCQATLLDSDPYCAGFRSRYCSGGIVTPPESHKDEFIGAVIDILRDGKFDLLIPMSDLSTEYISDERDRILPYTRLMLPSKELVSLARFKDKAYLFMQEHFVPIPKTYFPRSFADVERLTESMTTPCVVKTPRGSANRNNAYFFDGQDIEEYYRDLKTEDLWPVIQEFVKGQFYGCTAIANEGEILDCFLYKAQQKYASNGTPPYGVSIVDEVFFQAVKKVIGLLRWTGAINLDFLKGDDGEYKFLEINPRLPGSLDFIYAVGLDFPSLYLDLAFGKADKKFNGFTYKPGKIFRFVLPNEIIFALRNKRHFPRLLLNFLNPRIATDIPWEDPKLLAWKLRHLWWYWRDKKHHVPLSQSNIY